MKDIVGVLGCRLSQEICKVAPGWTGPAESLVSFIPCCLVREPYIWIRDDTSEDQFADACAQDGLSSGDLLALKGLDQERSDLLCL